MKREFVQLAHKRTPKDSIGGWLHSEKLDGHRCYWDGGISRGILKSDIPWANTENDERYLDDQYATGLWSRYGNVIHASDWWLDKLPKCPLDGELWAEGLSRQEISSIIKKQDKSARWEIIEYCVFDIPPYEKVMEIGFINNTNFKKHITVECLDFVYRHIDNNEMDYVPPVNLRYESAYAILATVLYGEPGVKAKPFKSGVAHRVLQKKLPFAQGAALEVLKAWTDTIVRNGGEGSMVRDPNATYVCERSHKLLKDKPTDDMEGKVIGYITGRETDKGSKLRGKMGAMVLTLDDGKRLELSGFTDQERALSLTDPAMTITQGYEHADARDWAWNNPETECPEWIGSSQFPRGTRVSFKYRGLSDEGIPQEARYWRKDEQI